jgi:hypothetical protein
VGVVRHATVVTVVVKLHWPTESFPHFVRSLRPLGYGLMAPRFARVRWSHLCRSATPRASRSSHLVRLDLGCFAAFRSHIRSQICRRRSAYFPLTNAGDLPRVRRSRVLDILSDAGVLHV